MQILKRIAVSLVLTILSVTLVTAQATCPDIAQQALQVVIDDCATTGRNEACYGNGLITLTARDGNVVFNSPGDRVDVAAIDRLTLSPLDESAGYWGISLLNIQADLPETLPGQSVVMLLFGDAELINDGDAMEAVYFRSGIGTPDCAEAPNGLLIQTEAGAGTVNLTVNDVQIELGSTAFLQASPEDELIFALLEGVAELTVDDETVSLVAGELTTIPMDADLSAAGVPSIPEPIGEALDPFELPTDALPPTDTDITDADSADTAAGGNIVPVSGDWTITLGELTLSDDCPSFLSRETLLESLNSFGFGAAVTQTLDFGDTFDFDVLFDSAELEAAGLSYDVNNPEANVYQMVLTLPEGAGDVIYTYRLRSEMLIEGDILQNLVLPSIGTCTIEFDFVFDYVGG